MSRSTHKKGCNHSSKPDVVDVHNSSAKRDFLLLIKNFTLFFSCVFTYVYWNIWGIWNHIFAK